MFQSGLFHFLFNEQGNACMPISKLRQGMQMHHGFCQICRIICTFNSMIFRYLMSLFCFHWFEWFWLCFNLFFYGIVKRCSLYAISSLLEFPSDILIHLLYRFLFCMLTSMFIFSLTTWRWNTVHIGCDMWLS